MDLILRIPHVLYVYLKVLYVQNMANIENRNVTESVIT